MSSYEPATATNQIRIRISHERRSFQRGGLWMLEKEKQSYPYTRVSRCVVEILIKRVKRYVKIDTPSRFVVASSKF